tara:strand:+ start:2199 stop:2474 length:276 start_codon:yes stop_codon:yes gene_type:complete
MTSKRKKRPLFLLALTVVCCAALPSCVGPNPVRLASERANWRLASTCAEGWFESKPVAEHDKKLIRDALGDWDRALTADEELVGWPLGGSK